MIYEQQQQQYTPRNYVFRAWNTVDFTTPPININTPLKEQEHTHEQDIPSDVDSDEERPHVEDLFPEPCGAFILLHSLPFRQFKVHEELTYQESIAQLFQTMADVFVLPYDSLKIAVAKVNGFVCVLLLLIS